MSSQNPLISICIPTYNGVVYLQEALDSVKAQTYANLEVIVSDDASKDDTLIIVENFKNEVDFPVHVYHHEPSGIGANWNHCIEKSNGEYIKFLFQDDVLESNCVELMYQYLVKNNLDIVASKRSIIDAQSSLVLSGAWYKNYNDLQQPVGLFFDTFIILSRKNFKKLKYKRISEENIIGEPCVSLFSKKLYEKIGPFNKDLKQILDYEYWLRVLSKFDIGIIEEKLVKFRYHDKQTSNINFNNNVSERHIIVDILFKKFFFDFTLQQRKDLIKDRFPMLRDIIRLRYKYFL